MYETVDLIIYGFKCDKYFRLVVTFYHKEIANKCQEQIKQDGRKCVISCLFR